MDYHRNPFGHSSDTSALEYYPRSTDVSSQWTSSNHGHLPIVPKIENQEAHEIKAIHVRRHARPTVSRPESGRDPRKKQRRARSPKESNFPGLTPAELKSERYLKYREKARLKAKDPKSQNANVWPDELENAFQHALRVHPPMGRKKIEVNGVLCGRNELITKEIKKWTGVDRDRKKVSSHIQTLKKFMFDNAECEFDPGYIRSWPSELTRQGMKHVTLDTASAAAQPSSSSEIKFGTLTDAERDLYARSCYGDIGQPVHTNIALSLPPPGGILRSNAPNRGLYLNRVEFEMFILSPSKEKFHNYTSNQADIAARSRALEEIPDWRTSFPSIKKYYDQGQLKTDVILIESNLDLLSEYPPKNSTLSIRFIVNITGVSGNERWSTKADYYENNGQPVDMKSFYAMNNIRKVTSWDTPNIFQGAGSSDVRLEIPLQSTWWVQLFTKMAARKQEMKHDAYLSQQEDNWSRRYLHEMSIMQELWVDPGDGRASEHRVAIILWKFSQTRTGEAGTTTWRKLLPPPERIKVNSPRQSPAPLSQHSMVLDSAIRDLAMPQAISLHAKRFLQYSEESAENPDHIVTEPQSARESASPALSLDYTTSFPSSTSTSFPPSITHGYLSHEESQDSACYSQESERSRNGSLDGQCSFVFSQKSRYGFTEPRTYHDDLNYLSEEQGLDLQDPASYSQQCFDSLSHLQTQPQCEASDGALNFNVSYGTPYTAHDFTGGQIQLSLQCHDSHSHAYPTNNHTMHIEHSSRMDQQIDNGDLHPVTDGVAVNESNTAVDHRFQRAEFDFSTLETHFTPDEIAALHMQEVACSQHGELGELLRNHEETQGFEVPQLHLDQFHQQSSVTVMDHFDGPVLVPGEHGHVLGEVTDEDIKPVVHVIDEGLDIEENYDGGTQRNREELLSKDDGQDYDEYDLCEDAL
ncbi:MAG: hypothetical protein Q9219_002937 [cf. Caloplaca sp. 3 TL-2023]